MRNIKTSIFFGFLLICLVSYNGTSQSKQKSNNLSTVILSNFPSSTSSKQVDKFILDIKNYKCQSKKIGSGKFKISIPSKLRKEWIKPCPTHVYKGQNIVFQASTD